MAITTNYGKVVVDTNLVPYIRERQVEFIAQNLKPYKIGKIFFDDVAVNQFCQSPGKLTLDSKKIITVENKAGERLVITVSQVIHNSTHELGVDPGLVKDGVEAHLQELLAEHVETFGKNWQLVRREYPTAIGPVDLLCKDELGKTVAVEIKRRGDIDGVEQLTRYLELLNRDTLIAPVSGVFAAQEIKPQAKVLAEDRGIRCVVVDYDALRGLDRKDERLF